MYPSASFSDMAQRDLEEFEGDLERYNTANRRSVWFAAFVGVLALISVCTVCSTLVLLLR